MKFFSSENQLSSTLNLLHSDGTLFASVHNFMQSVDFSQLVKKEEINLSFKSKDEKLLHKVRKKKFAIDVALKF